jgi:hypothetical protein
MNRLLAWFPKASFEAHVSEEYASETESFQSPRIAVRIVHGRESAWVAHLIGEAIDSRPTIMLTGEGLSRWAPLARAGYVLSDLLTATRMHHVILALRRITSS